MERSARLYWYTSLSQFHEREIIYQWKGTSLPFPDTICPPLCTHTHTHPTSPHHVHPPTPRTPPRCRFFTFIVGRGNGCLRAPLCKCACVFEVGRMKASSSVWAQQQVGRCVGVCLYLSGKRTVRTRCVRVLVCVCVCARVDERLLVDLAFRWPPGCFAVWSACPRFCWGLERRSPSFPCCNTSVCTQANKHTWKINSLKQYREFSGLREKNRIIKFFPSCSSFNCLVCSLA